jgi:hypothetical protein
MPDTSVGAASFAVRHRMWPPGATATARQSRVVATISSHQFHQFPAWPSLQAPVADSSEEGLAVSGSDGSLDDGDLPELTETRRQRRRREQAEKKAASRHKKERKRKVTPEMFPCFLSPERCCRTKRKPG